MGDAEYFEALKASCQKLGTTEKEVVKQLVEKVLLEVETNLEGGARPVFSILRGLVHMTSDQAIKCIELYEQHCIAAATAGHAAAEAAAAPVVRVPPPPPSIEEQAPEQGQKADDYQWQREQKLSQWGVNGLEKRDGTKVWKAKGEHEEDTAAWPTTKWKTYWPDTPEVNKASIAELRGAELVLRECRAALDATDDNTLLLSKLGAALSYTARQHLEMKGYKLTRFLASYPDEFSIQKSGDGRESVSHVLGGKAALGQPDHSTAAWYGDWIPNSWEAEEWLAERWEDWDGAGSRGPKLYVGNLPADISQEELNAAFRAYGKVEDLKVMQGRSRRTGQSCAFVVYSNTLEAEECIKQMDQFVMRHGDGCITVKYADDQDSKGYAYDKDKGKATVPARSFQ